MDGVYASCEDLLCQVLIEPPKAARGHATNVDIEILNVTNNRIHRMYAARTCKLLIIAHEP